MIWRRFLPGRSRDPDPAPPGGVEVFDLAHPDAVERLRRQGVHCGGPALGRDNRIELAGGHHQNRRIEIDFAKGSGNRLFVGEGDRLHGRILLSGSNNVFRAAGHAATPSQVRIEARFLGSRNTIELGAGVTSNGTTLVVSGPGSAIRIGRDCMLSNGIWLRAADMHALIDLDTGEVINTPGDITLGDHVWVGQDAMVLKDVTLGSGSVVAAKALVNRSCDPHCLVAGVPARVVRERVVWTRKPRPRPEDIDAALALCQAGDADAALAPCQPDDADE